MYISICIQACEHGSVNDPHNVKSNSFLLLLPLLLHLLSIHLLLCFLLHLLLCFLLRPLLLLLLLLLPISSSFPSLRAVPHLEVCPTV